MRFSTPAVDVWADARVGTQEPFDGIWLRATAFDDTVCRLEVTDRPWPTACDVP
ncbi:hypothetical protein [Streptomyces alboflavus]|uniref:hypothetical protein n=1 Tax=Streptomyces alboflavus TaxID=67267 RepID=UPI000AD7FE05|nr:hypothetical protein [Streptomyces alboflavus]